MKTFRHILVATDFSEASQPAVRLATELARQFGASLTLLHAFEYPRALYSEAALYTGDFVEPVLEDAETRMAEIVRGIDSDILEVEAKIRQGVPHEQILAAAKECAADLIVMGTHGRTGVARLLLGSVAEKVVRLSPIPVLAVRQPAAIASHQTRKAQVQASTAR
jgi:nucleotide-binding universal stress UspA family protein